MRSLWIVAAVFVLAAWAASPRPAQARRRVPVNTAPPAVSGTDETGWTLTESNGTWKNSPTSYSHQWQDCDSAGANCVNVSGATSQTYTLARSDVGHTIRVEEWATDSGGTGGPAASSPTGTVIALPPSDTAMPTISGTAQVGDMLTAQPGTWSGDIPMTWSYHWSDGITGQTDTLLSTDAGQYVSVTVTAANDMGTASATSQSIGPVTASGGGSGGSGLPPGVSLHQIDGGPSYYCSNGFTNACNAGWDNPSFFPILDDYSFYPSNSTTTFKTLGLNTTVRVTGDTNLSSLDSAGIFAIPSPGEGSNPGPETTGWHVEEPSSWSSITSTATAAPGGGAGRFFQPSFTWNQFVYGGVSGTPCGSTMQATMSCTSGMPTGRHLDIPTADIYWFACSTTSFCQTYDGRLIYGLSGSATPDELARGSNYGDMVDQMRSWVSGNAPSAPYIETEDGLVGSGSREITPPEFNWAAWSTIVHGTRWLVYFGTTSNFGSGSTFGFSQKALPGQSVSMYQQAKATDTLVDNLAPIINSPFALGYATVTPAAYVFPTPHKVWDSGIDIMAKYYTGGGYSNSSGSFSNGFYIFASPRGSESQTNIQATFTTADGYTGPVTVVSENRTVQATSGKFSDTFAHASTVHIYQIP